ncbi:four helix bundle protein [Paludibacter sp. 221]|uniref:four helix bundle protein n=1 Tax=Paludibacter sp. 221 TaxID=2302939 RepID=UPI0013D4F234|nr:four helix bundle protein [Paludibacter sp. 221]NDV46378.1 four helix bundle protein [Paludibacter sp. 221]
MATYENLPVYKVSYDLLLLLFKSSKHMQRDYRYTLGESMKKELMTLLQNIYRANCATHKKELLATARENVEVIRLQFRLCNDLNQFPLRDFVRANEYIESLSKQLTAWERSVKQ